jgi:hypothetical protein
MEKILGYIIILILKVYGEITCINQNMKTIKTVHRNNL